MIKCTLDEDECIDLLTLLRIINQITQEQAWAICYEIGTLMQRLSPNDCAPIDNLAQIQLHKDGFVHEKSCSIRLQQLSINQTTIVNDNNNQIQSQKLQHQSITTAPPTPPITPELNELLRRRPALNEAELVASLGIALFWALDYGIANDEERKLSIAMEYLIFQSQSSEIKLNEILDICKNRLPVATKMNADAHYKEVLKSLIKDTIELSIFLEKIYTASMVLRDITLDECCLDGVKQRHHNNKCDISDDDLDELGEPLASLRALRINNWARLWMQVIRELRQRGRFNQAALSVS